MRSKHSCLLILVSALLLSIFSGFGFAEHGRVTKSDGPDQNFTNLTCCTINQPPYTVSRKSRKGGKRIEGIAIENFQKLTEEIEDELGRKLKCARIVEYQNGGFDEAVDEMFECAQNEASKNDTAGLCICDIHLSMFVVNGRRFKLVDQIPVHFTEFQLVTTVENANAGGAAIDLLFIFRAFTLSVWFLVLGLLVVSIFAFGAIFRFSAGRGATVLWRAIEAAVSFGLRGDHNDMQQGNTVSGALRPSHAAALIFLTGTVCLISGTFVNSVYNSAVTGRILEVKIRSVIDGIEDFANCKVSLRQMVVLRNGAPHTHIKEFVANTECHQGEDKEPLFVDAIPDGFRYIAKNRKENLYYFVQKDLVDYEIQKNYCRRLVPVGNPFFTMSEGFIVPKSSPLTPLLQEGVLLLRQKDKLTEVEIPAEKCEIVDETSQVGVRHLILFFVISYASFGAIIAASLFLSWVERRSVSPDALSEQEKCSD